MKLFDTLLQHTQGWRFVFPQVRSLERAIALAFGILCGVGKRRAYARHQFSWEHPERLDGRLQGVLPFALGAASLV